jgi:YfiR/HmsC-like
MGRRWLLRVTLLCVAATLAPVLAPLVARADDDVAVPVPLQIELLLKVAGYDKNLAARAPSVVRVLVLTKGGNAQSTRVGQAAARALEGKTAGSRPVEVSTQAFMGAAALAAKVKGNQLAIVYVTPGFDASEMDSIAKSLAGISVLSAGALTRFIDDGVVLGFELVSGKPKLLVHLKRAHDQSVELSSQVLKIVRVIE